jgi:Ca2+-binding RTX toxin-like protein
MPIQKKDLDTQWTINQSNLTWTLAEQAKITVTNEDGIDESGFSGNEIKVFGDIDVTGNGFAGVRVTGSDSSVLIGTESRIDAKQADYGVYSEAAGADIVNRGEIVGDYAGIYGSLWSNVDNYGTIKGVNGVVFAGTGSQIYNYGDIRAAEDGIMSDAFGTHIENGKDAEIIAGDRGIYLEGSGTAEIVNRGLIRGDGSAIESLNGALNVTNTGRIVGDVVMSDEADTFDTRKGEVKGLVIGGDGNDTYKVGASNVAIVEGDGVGDGYDTIEASASFKIASNVEKLKLIGKKDIDGTGNGDSNVIYGNAGDNKITTGAGGDRLFGGRGNDILEGGVGNDVFHFASSGDGIDRITDYDDAMDEIAIGEVDTLAEFDALDIKQVKGDVVINLGGGDKIIIENMFKSDFEFNDIFYP